MFMLDVPNSYHEYKVFKRKVLSVAVKELRENVKRFAKLSIEEVRKEGKKVEELRFIGCGVGVLYKPSLL